MRRNNKSYLTFRAIGRTLLHDKLCNDYEGEPKPTSVLAGQDVAKIKCDFAKKLIEYLSLQTGLPVAELRGNKLKNPSIQETLNKFKREVSEIFQDYVEDKAELTKATEGLFNELAEIV